MNIKTQLSDNGYVVLKRVLPEEAVNDAKRAILQCSNQQLAICRKVGCDEIHKSLKHLFAADLTRYKKTVASLWRLVDVYNVLQHGSIQDILKKQLDYGQISAAGGQVVHLQSKHLKIPGGYFGLPAHQDFPSVNGSLDGVIVWTPLIDNINNQFPLQIIPKSHKNGLFPTLEDSDIPWEIDKKYYSEQDFISVECSVTDIVIMSTFTIHRSGIVGDNGLKLSCSARFDNVSETSFIDNAYPSAYRRSVDREQHKDNPFLPQFCGTIQAS